MAVAAALSSLLVRASARVHRTQPAKERKWTKVSWSERQCYTEPLVIRPLVTDSLLLFRGGKSANYLLKQQQQQTTTTSTSYFFFQKRSTKHWTQVNCVFAVLSSSSRVVSSCYFVRLDKKSKDKQQATTMTVVQDCEGIGGANDVTNGIILSADDDSSTSTSTPASSPRLLNNDSEALLGRVLAG